MILEQEIKDWWERKITNYLQNYTRRNRLIVVEAKEIFFIETHEKFVESVPNSWSNSWMRKPDATKEQQLLEKLIWGGRTNFSEWFEKIVDNFYEEQAVEDRTLVETVKEKFYTDLAEQFLCSLPTFLFKFLIEKGVAHIVEPRPSLHELETNSNWAEKQRKWEEFITEREWEYFLSK